MAVVSLKISEQQLTTITSSSAIMVHVDGVGHLAGLEVSPKVLERTVETTRKMLGAAQNHDGEQGHHVWQCQII